MKRPVFAGLCTALVTPFRGGGLDVEMLRRLICRQIEAGVDAIVLGGTTGESPTMTTAEKVKTVLDLAVDFGCSVIAGDITARAVKGKGKVATVCGILGGSALGAAAGRVACREVDEFVDAVDTMMKMRKPTKEDTADA